MSAITYLNLYKISVKLEINTSVVHRHGLSEGKEVRYTRNENFKTFHRYSRSDRKLNTENTREIGGSKRFEGIRWKEI
jgi:hypothetical protein